MFFPEKRNRLSQGSASGTNRHGIQRTQPDVALVTCEFDGQYGRVELAVEIEVYERALRQGAGRSFANPQRAMPRI
ncbi:MAG: hypothetical protein JO166_10680 [Deltaproteobacteria bacterium]|nr:hypothetical protein [Deltaproteobacteria bacterium]